MLSQYKNLLEPLKVTRHTLHAHPETGRSLPLTTLILQNVLNLLDIPVKNCGDGFIAELSPRGDAPLLALRADMDALPVHEETGCAWSSENDGFMHACGHDVHMTCALGALAFLSKSSSRKAGLRVLFQPDEEGDGGAERMIDDGALEGVSNALCLHVAPALKVGTFGLMSGAVRGAGNMFDVELSGKGAHGAYPDTGIDALAGGAQIVSALQTMISREVSPLDPAVVTVGKFIAGNVRNVIPDKVRFEGIMRTMSQSTREFCVRRLQEIIRSMAAGFRLDAEITMRESYPALINDREETELVASAASKIDPGSVVRLERAQMGVDDFAYIAQQVPSCYVDLGCITSGEKYEPLHSPRFLPSDESILYGTSLICEWVALHEELAE